MLDFDFITQKEIEIFSLQPGIEIEIITDYTVWGCPLIILHLAGNRFIYTFILREGKIELFSTPHVFSVGNLSHLLINFSEDVLVLLK